MQGAAKSCKSEHVQTGRVINNFSQDARKEFNLCQLKILSTLPIRRLCHKTIVIIIQQLMNDIAEELLNTCGYLLASEMTQAYALISLLHVNANYYVANVFQ